MSYDRNLYIMDDPREAQRLDAKVDPEKFIHDFLSPVLSEEHQIIADVGCGAGAIISTISKKFPAKQCIGVDISSNRLQEAKKKSQGYDNIVYHQGSIYELPIESNSVDVIYTRFLLEYLRDPVEAIAEMKRVIKPGGHVVLQDLDGQLLFQYPFQVPEMQDVLDALHRKTGFDPYIGRKLYHYSRKAGLVLNNIDIRPYHLYAGRIDDFNYQLWDTKLEIAMPEFTEVLGIDRAQAMKDKFMEFLLDEDTLLYSNLFTLYLTK